MGCFLLPAESGGVILRRKGIENMEQEIIKFALSNGIFAALFVWLLFYVLKENSKREAELRATIDSLAEKFDLLKDIEEGLKGLKEDVKEVKDCVFRRKESA